MDRLIMKGYIVCVYENVGDPSALVPLDATNDAATIGLLAQLSGGVNLLNGLAVTVSFPIAPPPPPLPVNAIP